MGRIGELDLPNRLAPAVPEWVSSLIIGLAAAASAGVLRFVLDQITPGVAAFALIFPAVTVATLFARWLAGATTASVSVIYIWLFVYPRSGAYPPTSQQALISVLSVCIALGITIAVAELFRRAVRRASDERDREILERDLFLEEFDHRVKNNFTLVAALLDMQRRRAKDAETQEALSSALTRVESIARAHRHLYRGEAVSPGDVDMAVYLEELSAALAEALFLRGAITLDCSSVHAELPRDRAVSIGLIVNELVTNAAKHAFAGREAGRIEVRFEAAAPGWKLTVRDDGVGLPEVAKPRKDGGLGQRLIEGFVRQARGTAMTDSGPDGTRVTVALEA
ncbi:histidine kinase dimerization/phosphoacceptor domain -containing protein [Sphingomonas sp. HITSZ_GF]|uniref:sensor histidine kinase n=1 Tax=Sphingomonas sp. HITSZ_GF TaxID=3037247 RepID=UPI00240D29F1|nr:histidine kinase dimerization/phosphoacceptor domain -containing protein [Sphingomonas sp. HITSZ_GF]MDG2533214.1 histidine kinase dimerization/phosphoacceptor domain -containing protein [Sphingomonas sp. HITSZ_GF]